jgi:hypothetical protein
MTSIGVPRKAGRFSLWHTGRLQKVGHQALEYHSRYVALERMALSTQGFELGLQVSTGSRLFNETGADNPVRKAYELFVGEVSERSGDLGR